MKFFSKKTLVLFLIFISLYLLIVILDQNFQFLDSTEIRLYKRIADEILSGKLPYINYLFEYPLGSLIDFLIPKFTEFLIPYFIGFSLHNIVLMFLTTYFSQRIINLFQDENHFQYTLFQFIIIVIFFPLILNRYDVFPMFLTTFGLYLYLIGEKKSSNSHKFFSYIIITFAGWVKLYSFLLLPILIIHEFKKKEFRKIISHVLIFILTSLPFIIYSFFAREGLQYFLNYHGCRGLELESTYSSILLFLEKIHLVPNLNITYTYASYGLDGNLPNFIAKLSFPIFLISYALLCLHFYFSKESQKHDFQEKSSIVKIFTYSFLSISIFILMNKVFSAQYIIWLLPFFGILPFLLPLKEKKQFILLSFLTVFFTILIFPLFWEYLIHKNFILILILLLRNFLLTLITLKILLRYQIPKASFSI